MKMILKFLLTLMILINYNCITQNIILKEKIGNINEPTISITNHFIFWGLWQNKKIDLVEECFGENPIRIKEKYTLKNIISSLITFGIYNPRTSDIWCEKGNL